MSNNIKAQAREAIEAEVELQNCYRRMSTSAASPKVRAVIHDLLLMEEMNEILLRSLDESLSA